MRKSLTPRERAQMVLDQNGVCGCGCGQELGARFIAEHELPVALGNPNKPDCLLRWDCAKAKTVADVRRIAKAKRQAGEKGQRARRERRGFSLLKSAPFRGWRKMNGDAVWRNER